MLEFAVNQKASTIGEFAKYYQKRFVAEKINTLFQLRAKHSIFNCQKNADQIIMNIDIFAAGIDANLRESLILAVESAWNSPQIKLKLNNVVTPNSNTIQIISIAQGISNVPNDNPHIVYLNTTLPLDQITTVIAHEFGHVLGFPDCYIEFFDNAKKELVYYEPAGNNLDIMCSMRPGVSVPSNYFSQLVQSSCNFR